MAYGVLSNSYQGYYDRVLCVCSAGILRSATAAHILSAPPYNLNTRNAGTASYALIPVTEDLIQWADYIICMEPEHEVYVRNKMMDWSYNKPIMTLHIEDIYEYRNPDLIKLIEEKYNKNIEEFKNENHIP
jgi:predicted protein tyrosine phosphatase